MISIVEQVYKKQMKALGWIYLVLFIGVISTVIFTMLLVSPERLEIYENIQPLVDISLLSLSLCLLLLVIPITRIRLHSKDKVKNADAKTLANWGVPDHVDPVLGRQAAFLTRYTAGCLVCWGVAAAIGLYGLIGQMFGSQIVLTGIHLSAAVFVMIFFPPRKQMVRNFLEEFQR